MKKNYIRIRNIVERELASSAHDLEHIMRVYNLALLLAKDEKGVDLDILKPAVLLHDIARVREDRDDTRKTDHAIEGAKMAVLILKKLHYPLDRIRRIEQCILTHRYRSGSNPSSIEAKILFDADKLDVMGAIGLARSYMIAGEYGEKIYSAVPIDKYIKENLVGGKADGRIRVISKHAPNIEMETKVRHIPEKLYSTRGKKIAKSRLKFMETFFSELENEISGKR